VPSRRLLIKPTQTETPIEKVMLPSFHHIPTKEETAADHRKWERQVQLAAAKPPPAKPALDICRNLPLLMVNKF
jgi:hypothetical protein